MRKFSTVAIVVFVGLALLCPHEAFAGKKDKVIGAAMGSPTIVSGNVFKAGKADKIGKKLLDPVGITKGMPSPEKVLDPAGITKGMPSPTKVLDPAGVGKSLGVPGVPSPTKILDPTGIGSGILGGILGSNEKPSNSQLMKKYNNFTAKASTSNDPTKAAALNAKADRILPVGVGISAYLKNPSQAGYDKVMTKTTTIVNKLNSKGKTDVANWVQGRVTSKLGTQPQQ